MEYVIRTNSRHGRATAHLADCHVVNGLVSTGTPLTRSATLKEAPAIPGADRLCAYCEERIELQRRAGILVDKHPAN